MRGLLGNIAALWVRRVKVIHPPTFVAFTYTCLNQRPLLGLIHLIIYGCLLFSTDASERHVVIIDRASQIIYTVILPSIYSNQRYFHTKLGSDEVVNGEHFDG